MSSYILSRLPPHLGSAVTHILDCLQSSCNSLTCSPHLFCVSFWIVFIALSSCLPTISSAVSNLLLIQCNFYFRHCGFISKYLIWVLLKMSYIPLLNIFLFCLNTLTIVTVTWTSLFILPPVSAAGLFLLIGFSPQYWLCFPVFIIFRLKLCWVEPEQALVLG